MQSQNEQKTPEVKDATPIQAATTTVAEAIDRVTSAAPDIAKAAVNAVASVIDDLKGRKAKKPVAKKAAAKKPVAKAAPKKAAKKVAKKVAAKKPVAKKAAAKKPAKRGAAKKVAKKPAKKAKAKK